MARRRRESGGGPGSGDWLNTYADMVTLLLTFFILLFSMSSLNAAKFNMLVSAFASDIDSSAKIVISGAAEGDQQTGSFNIPDADISEPVELEDIFRQLSEYIEANRLNDSVDVSMGEGYVFVRFMDDMLFEPNSAVLKPNDEQILDFVGNGIKSVQESCRLIQINGHTASVPNNPDYAVSDWLLSAARANAVLMHFEDEIGIDSMKLQCVGWGKTKPFATNDTEAGRSKNRRVEILISSESPLVDQLDNIYRQLVD